MQIARALGALLVAGSVGLVLCVWLLILLPFAGVLFVADMTGLKERWVAILFLAVLAAIWRAW